MGCDGRKCQGLLFRNVGRAEEMKRKNVRGTEGRKWPMASSVVDAGTLAQLLEVQLLFIVDVKLRFFWPHFCWLVKGA